jgi:hypothetical protein
MGGPPVSRMGVGLKPFIVKYKIVTKIPKESPTRPDYLNKLHKQKNIAKGFGTWNVKSLHMADSLVIVLRELLK